MDGKAECSASTLAARTARHADHSSTKLRARATVNDDGAGAAVADDEEGAAVVAAWPIVAEG